LSQCRFHAKKAQKHEHGGHDGKPVKVEIVQFGSKKDGASAPTS
jgi:hypothetical protein